MSNVVNLKGQEVQPVNQELVDQLEMMLAQAKDGQLVACAYVGVYADGNVRTGWQKTTATTDGISSGLVLITYRYGATMCGHSA